MKRSLVLAFFGSLVFLSFLYAQQESRTSFLTSPSASASSVPASPLPASAKIKQEAKVADDKERMSLDLKGIDIVELFRILSLKMGVSIVPSKNVSGRINVFLNNLTFEEMLDVILISQDLACERMGNTINVMTSAEYEKLYGRKYNEKRKFASIKLTYAKPATVANALNQLKSEVGKVIMDETSGTIFLLDTPERLELMKNTVKDLDQPIQTEVFDLQYAKAEDIKSHLSSVVTAGPGEVMVDSRSTKVVVSDLPEKMKKIKRIIKAFDAETPQVLIETKIVELTLREEFQRDVNWETIFRTLNNLDFKGTFPISASFTPSPGLSTASQKISIGTVSDDNYTTTLKFLQTLGETRVVSQPTVVAVNNQESKIMVGSREAYVIQTLSQAETSTVSAENIQFIDVGVKLNIVPTINRDGFITMKIKPEVSSVRETVTTTLGSRVPIVETSEVETVVKVKDGTMIMIAGLIKDETYRDETGTPGLTRTPLLGRLFGSKATQKKRKEVIVFLTPRIIRGDVNPYEKQVEAKR